MRGIGAVVRSQLEALSEIDSGDEYILLRWPGAPEPEFLLRPPMRWRWLEVPRPSPRQAGWLLDRWRLPSLLAGKADVAHFMNPFDLDMGWAVKPPPGLRTVVTVHDLVPVRNPDLALNGRLRLARPLFRRMAAWLDHADVLACNSRTTAEEVCEWFGRELPQARVVPLGIDPRFRVHGPEETSALCRRLGLEAPFLLYVGGLGPNKNLVTLLSALVHVPEVPLLVIATSSEAAPEHPVRMTLASLGLEHRVRFVVGLSTYDLACLYSAAHLFVLPSLWEGFGLPVVEAMASGTPVACSGIPALRDTAGDAAVLFDARDATGMASTLATTWTDAAKREDLRRRGLERALAYRWSETARCLLQVYADLA